MSETLTKI